MIGGVDSGKTFLLELAMTPFGNDRDTGKSYSYSNLSEHSFGKKILRGSTPVIVSDPPTASAMDYAGIVESVFDGNRRQKEGLQYDPGAGPLLSMNSDFLKVWQGKDPAHW